MSSSRPDPSTIGSEARPLQRWERWGLDWAGQPIVEWDHAAHAAWCAKWAPPCPDGNPQRPRRVIAFRERNVCELELRVPLAFGENGACQVIFDESDDTVLVRVLVCFDPETDVLPPREFVDCPVRVWLARPLEHRTVVDVRSNETLPLYSLTMSHAGPPQENPPASSSTSGTRVETRTDLQSQDP